MMAVPGMYHEQFLNDIRPSFRRFSEASTLHLNKLTHKIMEKQGNFFSGCVRRDYMPYAWFGQTELLFSWHELAPNALST